MKRATFYAGMAGVLMCLLFNLGVKAQDNKAVTIHVESPGTLPELIASDMYSITSLTLTGNLNGTDIGFIRLMAGRDADGGWTDGVLSVLDLSGTNIVAGGDAYYSNYFTRNNVIGEMMFYECGKLGTVILPKSVTAIEAAAFSSCDSLSTVSIPGSVTYIGMVAFSDCPSLTSVSIPGSVTYIGLAAFSGCESLTSISIPGSVAFIGIEAFAECEKIADFVVDEINPNYSTIDGVLFDKAKTRLIAYPEGKQDRSYIIPDGITSIGIVAFLGSHFTSLTIPKGVASIEMGALSGCDSLTSVVLLSDSIQFDMFFSGCDLLKTFVVSADNPSYSTIDGVLVNKDKTRLIAYPIGKNVDNYIIPDGITFIEKKAFMECELTSVTISSSVKAIEKEAFSSSNKLKEFIVSDENPYYSSIDGVLVSKDKSRLIVYPSGRGGDYVVPETILSIDAKAFTGCSSLKSVAIPSSVAFIEKGAFFICEELEEFIVSDDNFHYSSIDGVLVSKDKTRLIAYPNDHFIEDYYYVIPQSITSIESFVFTGGDFESMEIPEIVIPDNVKFIADSAFFNCMMFTSISLPNTVSSIGKSGFEFCAILTTINIPNSITSIEENTFKDCWSLKSITIPNSVASIMKGGFAECNSLREIHCNVQSPPAIDAETFPSVIYSVGTLYVPKGTLESYRTAPIWMNFANIVEEELTAIPLHRSTDMKKAYADGRAIVVTGADVGERISVYTTVGTLLHTVEATKDEVRIVVPPHAIYLVRISDKTFKVAL